jgi:hypothetical protein
MIALAAFGAGKAPGDALHQCFVVHLHLDDAVDILPPIGEKIVERLGLGDGPRKAVENEPASLAFAIDTLGDETDDERVRHELAPRHDVPCLATKLAAGGHRRPQHVAGGKLDQRPLFLEQIGLSSLARAGRAEQDHDH